MFLRRTAEDNFQQAEKKQQQGIYFKVWIKQKAVQEYRTIAEILSGLHVLWGSTLEMIGEIMDMVMCVSPSRDSILRAK